jgi:two-component system, cell cycle sensor histidine kinase and response regulator CckA
LLQAQKLEAVGRLAGGVAHDFNNLLTTIIGNAELFLMAADAGDAGYQEVKVIRRTAGRAAELTRQLLALSRRQVMAPALLNLNNVLKGMSEMLPRMVGGDVQYELALDPNLRLVMADLSQMEQVVLNLVVNAREAMPAGGALRIATENVVLDEGQIYSEVEPGDYVCLSVADSGAGMPPAVQEHIWEPFFTTKSTGAGLGLATVYGIVKQLGGYIATHSQEGRGTIFEIYLRVAEVPASLSPPVEDAESADMPTGDDTILLVEDEFAIRELAHSVLTELGYRVVATRSAEDALQRLEQQPLDVDLVLSDVVLPGMSGGELVAELHRRYGAFKVLFTSGYTDDRLTGDDIAGDDAGFLAKPFTPRTLAQKVRAVLDGNHTEGDR